MNDTPRPVPSETPAETLCPSCGRFVGALMRCPHCGARVAKRMSIRVFRYAALAVGTVGLGLLYLMATQREIPVVKVGELKPTMNFAYVRVAGTVSGDTRIFKEGGRVRSLRFMLDDGTGEISVTAYRAQAEELVAANKVPRVGDRVEVAGALSVSADDSFIMRLQVPEQLVLTPEAVPVTPLAEITEGMVGSSLMIEGTIVRVTPPREGTKAPWTITLKDASGEREITFWDDIYAEIGEKILLMPGTPIRARVSVKTYRDKLQLSLGRGVDLEFPTAASPARLTAGPGAPASDAQEMALGDVTADLAGRIVKVQGRVAEIRAPQPGSKAPHELILQDDGQTVTVTVVYWDTVADRLDRNKPVVGALMSVRGMVSVYKEKVQLKVNHSEQLSLLDVAPASKPAVQPGAKVAISAITAAMAGSIATVSGTLGEPASLKGGVTFPLTDDSGSIKLLLWDRSVPGADRDRLTAGVKVTVTGKVEDYKGTLEIIPANAQSIHVESPAAP